jgi:hypothetical protein
MEEIFWSTRQLAKFPDELKLEFYATEAENCATT